MSGMTAGACDIVGSFSAGIVPGDLPVSTCSQPSSKLLREDVGNSAALAKTTLLVARVLRYINEGI